MFRSTPITSFGPQGYPCATLSPHRTTLPSELLQPMLSPKPRGKAALKPAQQMPTRTAGAQEVALSPINSSLMRIYRQKQPSRIGLRRMAEAWPKSPRMILLLESLMQGGRERSLLSRVCSCRSICPSPFFDLPAIDSQVVTELSSSERLFSWRPSSPAELSFLPFFYHYFNYFFIQRLSFLLALPRRAAPPLPSRAWPALLGRDVLVG